MFAAESLIEYPLLSVGGRIAHDVGQFGRPVEITSPRESWSGWLHRFIEKDGKAMAVVECKQGTVSVVDVSRVRFTDRGE